jgi:hypothetical protein
MSIASDAPFRLLPTRSGLATWPRGVVGTMLAAALIAAVIFLVFHALALASLRTDRASMAAPIAAAFADGALEREASWRIGDTENGAHQYNDCLILFQAWDDRAPAVLRAVSPLSVPVDTDNACATLADVVAGHTAPPVRHYHQYLHAHTTLARLLVPMVGVQGLRGLYKLALSLTLLAGISYALLGLAQGRRKAVSCVWLVIFLAFARWFGLESFGQSLGHGPADLIVLLFILFLARGSATVPLTPRVVVLASAAFGSLTLQFEFLTGGLPLGLAIVIGAVPLALSDRHNPADTVVRSVVAFLVAVIATVGMKVALIAALFGAVPLIDVGRQFLFRTGLGPAVVRDLPASGPDYASHVFAGLEALSPGMPMLVIGVMALAITAGGWGYARLRLAMDPVLRQRAIALIGSMLVPPLWMVGFWQHTAEHAWFMDRILVWIIAAGSALFVLALGERARVQS